MDFFVNSLLGIFVKSIFKHLTQFSNILRNSWHFAEFFVKSILDHLLEFSNILRNSWRFAEFFVKSILDHLLEFFREINICTFFGIFRDVNFRTFLEIFRQINSNLPLELTKVKTWRKWKLLVEASQNPNSKVTDVANFQPLKFNRGAYAMWH